MIEADEQSGDRVARRARRAAAAAACVVVAVVVAVASGLLTPASARAAGGAPGLATAAAAPAPVLAPSADTNGDRVFDDLAEQLAPLGAVARVNVIVRLDTPAVDMRLGLLQALVGPFSLGRVLALVDGFSATVTKEQVERLRTAPGFMMGQEYRRRHELPNPSTTQKALSVLVEDELVAKHREDGYRIVEPFFAEWIVRSGF